MEASYGQTRAALRGRVQPTSTAALLPMQKSSKWVVICHQRGANKGPNRTSRPNLLATSQWLGHLAALCRKGRRTSGSELLRASNWLQKTEEAPPVSPITRSPQPRAPAEVTPARGRPCSTDGGIRGRGHAVAHAEGVGRANGPPRGCSLHHAFHHVRPCSELAPQTGRSLVCTMCPQNAAATLCVTPAVYLSLPVPFDALSKRRKCSISLFPFLPQSILDIATRRTLSNISQIISLNSSKLSVTPILPRT